MQSREEVLAFGLTFPETYQDTPFHDQNWQLIRIKGSKKAFLWTYEMNGYININIKVDPEWRDFWRDAYEAVIPGYHQNKEHWNTVILDGSVPDSDIKRMIAESYELIAKTPSVKIYEAVKQIPKGKVATYADVAEMAGDRKMARAVGNALHKNPDPDNIPCFRVVNSKGELAGEFAFGGAGAQAKLLEAEGVEVKDGKVNLKKYRMELCEKELKS
ncbi:MAG: methylated-DNA--[protein]-cysteine S-methyltransferase [Lachnospiraceae bacterium]|nr:methylated-DNA--[protein]-cysteine S-methyltransferase [Lachnospiraceae bacterium]